MKTKLQFFAVLSLMFLSCQDEGINPDYFFYNQGEKIPIE